ncbi:hypothetical protein SCALIN_C10_0149 [Candidatus Scalindua japonica]|uniref:Uncharacterized protein n=1 Tax=Candidatus Scalindua japonica TaxID=1284222 RepID=A0A286TWW9_9BACT|nr:hypothetical protein [Candidatus Scalindua japonica]GAX60389.1 hypothetical protein SCALIN_C10_0149 [Candidatus Scalindua japonica]
MTKKEVLQKIKEARNVIEEYNNELRPKHSWQKETTEDENIKLEGQMLIKEALTLGSSGKPCPQCGGSGRI